MRQDVKMSKGAKALTTVLVTICMKTQKFPMCILLKYGKLDSTTVKEQFTVGM